MSLADWERVDAVDLRSLFGRGGVSERDLVPVEEAVSTICDRVIYTEVPEGTPANLERSIRRLEKALAVLSVGVDLQSQRYDERVREAEAQDQENEELRTEVTRLRQQVSWTPQQLPLRTACTRARERRAALAHPRCRSTTALSVA